MCYDKYICRFIDKAPKYLIFFNTIELFLTSIYMYCYAYLK